MFTELHIPTDGQEKCKVTNMKQPCTVSLQNSGARIDMISSDDLLGFDPVLNVLKESAVLGSVFPAHIRGELLVGEGLYVRRFCQA